MLPENSAMHLLHQLNMLHRTITNLYRIGCLVKLIFVQRNNFVGRRMLGIDWFCRQILKNPIDL